MKATTGLLSFLLISCAAAFPQYGSLAGLSERELDEILPRLEHVGAQPPPGPINDTSSKLVNDKAHPWKPLRPEDIRGPCPGLNTLASHGYLPRNGIATPGQIVTAVQEGFNMPIDLATFVTYAAFIVDGNQITNLLSIGGKTPLTGPNPPKPAIVGGLDTHAVFEGDASTTRGDAYFGDNHSFQESLFQELTNFSNRFGAGNYNLTVAGEFRFQRIQDSIATNPTFTFTSPRFFTAYAESVFPVAFFVDGRKADGQLDMKTARGFFQNSHMPDGFFRPSLNYTNNILNVGIDAVFSAHPIQPGKNQGRVNSYTPDPNSADFSTFCKLYQDFVNVTIKGLYPNPKGALRDALKVNLHSFFLGFNGGGDPSACPELFPYGK